MNTNATKQASINASYVVNSVNGQINVVVSKKTEREAKLTSGIKFTKTHYSIDTNGGGYTGL